MLRTLYRFWQWFCEPDDVNLPTAFCLVVATQPRACLLGAFYAGVMIDNWVLNEHPIHQVVADMDSFMQDIERNVSGHQLLKGHLWLRHAELLITGSCSGVPKSLKYLRYTGFVCAGYSTVLMHLLLRETFPASAVAWIPIITSLGASCIDGKQILLLGLFHVSQTVLWLIIQLIFDFRKTRRMRIVLQRAFMGG